MCLYVCIMYSICMCIYFYVIIFHHNSLVGDFISAHAKSFQWKFLRPEAINRLQTRRGWEKEEGSEKSLFRDTPRVGEFIGLFILRESASGIPPTEIRNFVPNSSIEFQKWHIRVLPCKNIRVGNLFVFNIQSLW